MKRRNVVLLSILLAACCLAHPAFAASKQVKVQVNDSQGKPVAGVTVTLKALSGDAFEATGTTDEKGKFKGEVPDFERDYSLEVAKSGYQPFRQTIVWAAGKIKKGDREAQLSANLIAEEPHVAPYRRAIEAIQKQDMATARKEFETVIGIKPDLAQAHSLLSLVLVELKDFAAGVAAAERALALNPADAEALRSRYDAYAGLNDEAKRLTALRALAAQDRRPEVAVLAYNEAARAWKSENWALVREMATLASDVNPRLPQAWQLLARVAIIEKDGNAAIAATDKALAISATDRTSLRLRIDAFKLLELPDKVKEAEAALAALEKKP